MTTLITIGKAYIDFKEKELEKILVSKPRIKCEPDQGKFSTIEKGTKK